VAGVGGETGVEDLLDFGTGGEELSDCLRILAGALQAQRKGADGAEGEPGLHGTEYAAGEGSPLIDLLAKLEVADGDVAEEDVAVAGHGLGVGGDGEVGAQGEGGTG